MRRSGSGRRCVELGVESGSVTFRIGLSHEILARWEPRPLDLVLVDGAHGFPYPILDWWHVAAHARVGGTVLLDDAYLPAVAAIVDFARSSEAWQVEDAISFRTAAHEAADEPPPFMAAPTRPRAGCASYLRRTAGPSPRHGGASSRRE